MIYFKHCITEKNKTNLYLIPLSDAGKVTVIQVNIF